MQVAACLRPGRPQRARFVVVVVEEVVAPVVGLPEPTQTVAAASPQALLQVAVAHWASGYLVP